jgi:hypothetical protein
METPEQAAGRELQNQLTQAARQRIATLEDATRLRAAMQALLQHEARRIESKFGSQHPRTKTLEARVQANVALMRGLEIERQLLQIKVPAVDERAALVHGRVVDQEGFGIDRLVVALVEPSGAPIRETTDSTTDDSGYFAIVVDSETIDRLLGAARGGVFLAVLTSRRRPLVQQPRPLLLAQGARLTVSIVLDRSDLTAAQPAPILVSVPDLIGRAESEALAVLQEVGLKLGRRETAIAPDRVGRVLEQSPPAGTQLAQGSAVSLVLGAAEVAPVQVPNLVRVRLREAKQVLARAQLTLGNVSGPSPTDESIIERQEPGAGTEVPRGTAINVVVG